MAVVLVRHAQDAAAAAGRFGDEGLSPRGRDQAARLRQRLSSLEFRAALVSPLARARETAAILTEGWGVPSEVVPELAEGAVGLLAGLSRREGLERHPDALARGFGVVERLAASGRTAPGGETRADFRARAARAAERARHELARDGHVLVVSHGGLLDAMLQQLFAMAPRDELVFGFEHAGAAVLAPYPHAAPGKLVPHLWFYAPDLSGSDL